MSSKYKFLMVMLGLLASSNANAYYKSLSPSNFDALYSLAAHGNVSAINHAISRGLNINSVNKNGDTGLCVAAKRRDKKAFKSFLQAGANPSHPCTWEIRGYRDFMEEAVYDAPKKMDTATNAKELVEPGMSWKTKTLIGTGVVAAGAGVALALGGGGGGGGSDNKVDLNCRFGYYEGDKCVCYTGYIGEKCDSCNIADKYENYETENCHKKIALTEENLNGKTADHVKQVGNKLVCKDEYTGDTCDDCAPGYGRNNKGDCKVLSVRKYGSNNSNANSSIININNDSDKYQHIYGMYYDKNASVTTIGTLTKDQMVNGYITTDDASDITITVTNSSDGDAYGMYSKNAEEIYNAYTTVPLSQSVGVEITAAASKKGNAYGIWGNNKIYSIYYTGNEETSAYSEIQAISVDGNAYGIYNESSDGEIYNLDLGYMSGYSSISTSTFGGGNAYGIYGLGYIENSGLIESENEGTGEAYGIYNKEGTVINHGINDDSGIDVSSSSGNAYGIWAENSTISNKDGMGIIAKSTHKNAYGIYATGKNSEIKDTGIIESTSTNKDAYGIYNKYGTVMNTDTAQGISVTADNGTAYGIYNYGGTVVNTNETKAITVTSTKGTAYGIYSDGGIVENSGKITVTGNKAYGIYATNGATVYNTGDYEIIANGFSLAPDNERLCNAYGCKFSDNAYAIYLTKGAKFVNEGTVISSASLSLPQGTQISTGGSYSSEVQISGNLDVASKAVSQGFENTYTLNNAVETPDASGLKLSSESVLFDASLQGSDIVLNKKDFDKLVDNKDVAKFLEQNYAQENNEQLFAGLKSATSIKELNKLTDTLTGQDIISRFTNEDLIMSHELDFDMNEKLFNLPAGKFSLANDISTKIFDENGSHTSYMLSGIEFANAHLGVGLAIQEIVSSDDNNNNARNSQNFQFMAPLQFKNKGFNTVVTPKLAYAYGTYDRNGYEGKNFEGTIEKQTASVSAETRYPFKLFGLDFAPASEISLSAYQTKISEDAKTYALSSDDTTYSATFGMGAYLSSSKDWAKNHKLNFMVGAMLYHEFADPYALKMKINGMNGDFTLRDENRQDNYIVLRSKFDYTKDNFSLYGDFLSYADSKFRTRLDVGFKYHF